MDWLDYFKTNREQRRPMPWDEGILVEDRLREPLIRSLQRFQVGEQGDGRHLKQGAATTGNPEYMAAIVLFIAEEQEHSRWLAQILRSLDAPLLKSHWSDTLFVWLRRMTGLYQEIMVLLIAELIAKRYYRALYEGATENVLKAVFGQILKDEEGHVAFHCETLHHAFAPLPLHARLIIEYGWRILYRAACLVVMKDHAGVLREMGVPSETFWRDCGLIFDEAAVQIFNPSIVRLNVPAR